MMKKRKKTLGGFLYYVTIFMLLGVIAFCLYKVVPYEWDRYKTGKQDKEIKNDYVFFNSGSGIDKEEEEMEPEIVREEYELYNIDFKALHELNPDIVAWIRFDNQDDTPIDYPVVYAGSNDAYLRTNIYGEYSISGTVFIEEKDDEKLNTPDDMTTIIYGHNMANNTYFGSLKRYRREDDFYDKNQYFTIYTEDWIYRYHIFSYMIARNGSIPYYVDHPMDSEEYQEYIDYACKNSLRDTGTVPATDQPIVMLSTCASTSAEPYRMCVFGVLSRVTPSLEMTKN